MKVGILTVSDKGARGERKDTSGPAIREIMGKVKAEVVCYQVVPDEPEVISKKLIEWSDQELDLILTTGGTGFSPRDNTPEATRAVIEKEAPGISEAIRHYGLQKTPKAMLSRGISGIRKQTLIINLPGSEKAVRESLDAIIDALHHAVEMISGEGKECASRQGNP